MNQLTFTPAVRLVQMIRARSVSAVELLDAHLDQIAKHNPKLNAICTLDEDNARRRAKQADETLTRGESWGPLHGIPMTVKDIFETQGLRTTAGYKPLKDYIPKQDATVVARLKAAGAIIIGKSNMARLAGDYQSTNDLFPRVNNPWNLDYTAGGSSGGSAAAIAAGLSPLELGNDFGGSMRQPAHFCGVYSLKPTDRRVSTQGVIPEVPGQPKCIRQIMTVGCFARSLKDLQLCFSLIAGADPRQPDVPPVPLDSPDSKPLSLLRLAWMDAWDAAPVAADIKSAIQTVVQTLAKTGADVHPWRPDNLELLSLLQVCNQLAAFNNIYAQPIDNASARRVLPFMFREATQGERGLRDLCNLTQLLPPLLRPSLKKYYEALTERDRVTAHMDQALASWDGLLCPVAATPAFTHRPSGAAIELDGRRVPYLLASGAYTMPFALTGHPAVVIPIGHTQTGLPIGMQIVGKRWREMELLAIAQEIDARISGFRSPDSY
ncbi:MAG: amidase [Leptolyngbyaceae cyanobacterium MO_188.B28]|nr:amidase [Leptolyngbyaceae cyanobacterium MO_188.B28]